MYQCLNPVDIRDPRYSYKKYMVVACGKCLHCKLNVAKMWSIRIMHELKSWDSALFVTLTYNDEHLPKDNSLDKRDLQLFFKRLRKNLNGRKIKYFACGEYGEHFFRPHYHCIIFGVGLSDEGIIQRSWSVYDKDNLEKFSILGFIQCGSVSASSANYVARYTAKGGLSEEECYKLGLQPQFLTMSRRPGIGSNLATCKEYQTWIANNGFCVDKGIKYSVPRYYKSKLEPQLLDKLRKKIVDYFQAVHNKNYHKLLGSGIKEYEPPKVNERERERQLWLNTCAKLDLKRGKL